MREECGLRVIDSRLLRRICRLKQDKVREVWKKLHNAELKESVLLAKYYLGFQIEEMGGTNTG